MKTTFIVSLLLLFSIAANAQSFELTPTGFVSTAEKENAYLEFPGVPAKDLYKETLSYINRVYRSPKDVVSSVDGGSVTVNGKEKQVIKRNGLFAYDMDYSANFQFKDGKVRINGPDFRGSAFTDKDQVLTI